MAKCGSFPVRQSGARPLSTHLWRRKPETVEKLQATRQAQSTNSATAAMDDLEAKKKKLGQLVMVGFEGTRVTDRIKTLIETYHVSTIILSSKNFENAEQTKSLILELQRIAQRCHYEYPIMFAIDQEGGMVSSLFDENYITQFPGAMALAATTSPELIYDISRAAAAELRSLGFSIVLGPVLDIVTKFSHQLIGVRSFGSSVEEVIKYAPAAARGFRDGGLLTFGKHFPGLNKAEISSLLELPMLTETLEQIESSNVLTFKALMEMDLLDGLEASGAAVPNISPTEFHACLSTTIMNDLLRRKLRFDGVVISECLEMEVLFSNLGFKQGVIMAAFATCDLILVCHNFDLQIEAIHALIQATDDGVLDETTVIDQSLRRIRKLQKKLPSWDQIYSLQAISQEMRARHLELSEAAYRKSITLVRDYNSCLPITKFFKTDDAYPESNGLLLLTPIITPLYSKNSTTIQNLRHFPGEEVFQEFGKVLSSGASFKVYHTSYTANGLTNLHERLIEKCKAVVLVTSETSRNLHQIGIAKHISVLCGGSIHKAPTKKPLIIAAVSSPYDFYYSKNIGSAYLCTYEYTDNAMEKLAQVLVGKITPTGCIPGEFPKRGRKENSATKRRKLESGQTQRRWLVDEMDLARDWKNATNLAVSDVFHGASEPFPDPHHDAKQIHLLEQPSSDEEYRNVLGKTYDLYRDHPNQKSFVVRNSSTNTLHGFILVWINERLKSGSIMVLFVEQSKRGQGIGESLYSRAIKYIVNEKGCETIQLSSPFPLLYFPTKEIFDKLQQGSDIIDDYGNELASNNAFFSFLTERQAWSFDKFRKDPQGMTQLNYVLQLDDLKNWSVSKKLVRQLQVVGIMFDICQDLQEVLQLIETHHASNPVLYELYSEVAKSDPGSVKVIVALEPTNKSVVGSIVVFSRDSPIANFYPFLGVFKCNLGVLTGLMIDPSYENLTDVFKLGLVCTSLSYLKKQNDDLDKCILVGVNRASNNINNFKDNGFEIFRRYFDNYGEKDKWL